MGLGVWGPNTLISVFRRAGLTAGAIHRSKHKYPKQVRDRIDYAKVPQVDFAKEVKENLMKGGGPGGQSVATTSNAVQLIHLATGVSIKCHETRSVQKNRERAQEKLITALDNHLNGPDSVESQAKRIQQALLQVSKDSAKYKRQKSLLARLEAKEDALLQKLDSLRAQPDQGYQTEHKILIVSDELEHVRDKISKIESEFFSTEEEDNNDKN